jgi:hypothetical protein
MISVVDKYPSTPENVYRSENIRQYERKADDVGCEDLANCIKAEGAERYYFDDGWIILLHDKKREEVDIGSCYCNPNGKVTTEQLWDGVQEYAKKKNAKKLTITTNRSPEAWHKKYGFTLKTYYMEKEL